MARIDPLQTLLSAAVRGLVDLFFPVGSKCAFCRRELPSGHGLRACKECLEVVSKGYRRVCLRCGRPLVGAAALGHGPELCLDCHGGWQGFDLARAAGAYDWPLSEAVHRLKFGAELSLAELLGKLMGFRLGELVSLSGALPDVIVPVPMHLMRLRERGFNQSQCLAQVVAGQYGLPVEMALQRIRATVPQKVLGRDQRLSNLKGAFTVKRGARVKGKRVLLVDDVITTGSTAEACAFALKDAGACRVDVLLVAAVPAIPAPAICVTPVPGAVPLTPGITGSIITLGNGALEG